MNEMTVLIVVVIAIFLVAAGVMVRIYKSLMDNPTPLDIELSSSAKYVIEGKTYYTENAAKARCLGILIRKKIDVSVEVHYKDGRIIIEKASVVFDL